MAQNRHHGAESLRASTRKLESSSQRNDSITVRTRDEKSNVVFRFSNSGNKTKSKRSNEADSNEFLLKYLTKLDREAIGVWSILGKPFVARGDPDLTLIKKAHQAREARKQKQKRKNAPRDSTTTTSVIPQTWGGSAMNTKQSTKKEVTSKTPNISEDDVPQTHHTSTEEYAFPKEFIIDSEMRCRQSKMGIEYAKIIEEQAHRSGPLFETLQMHPHRDSSCGTTNEMDNCTNPLEHQSIPTNTRRKSLIPSAATHRSLAAITEISRIEKVPNRKQEFCIDGTEIERWSGTFSSIRQRLHRDLYRKLAMAKLDRIEAYQSPDLLGITVNMASNPKDFEDLPKSHSMWTRAKSLQQKAKQSARGHARNYRSNRKEDDTTESDENERAHTFYREMLCFIERVYGGSVGQLDRGLNEEAIDFVMVIKMMLEDGLAPADNTFLFELLQAIENMESTHLQNMQVLGILSFIRRYFRVSGDDLNLFLSKVQWKMGNATKMRIMEKL